MDVHASRPNPFIGPARALTLIYAGAAMLTGVCLVYLSWQQLSSPLAMVAVVLLLTSPMLALLALLPASPTMRASLPLPDVFDSIARHRRALSLVRACRAHIGVLSAGALIQWISQLCGLADIFGFLVFYSAACALTAAACLPWLATCERRLTDELADQIRLRADRRPPYESS